MPLLLNTDIADAVNDKICGDIARIGGSVNQLLDYRKLRIRNIEDINLQDDFFGAVKLHSITDIRNSFKMAKKYVRQELQWLYKGSAIPRDRKTVLLDVHTAFRHDEFKGRYDSTISSNLIEHSPNPIFLLLNLHFMTRRNGYQFHAVPHYKYTYDAYRQPTPLAHFLEDFEQMTDSSDTTHHADYIRSAIELHGWMREFHRKYPVGPPYIHFHVFDEENTRALMELMFKDVVCDVLKNENFSDNVVLFRNELNTDFTERYRPLIERYSSAFLGDS